MIRSNIINKKLFAKRLWMPDMVVDGIKRGGNKPFILYKRQGLTVENITYNQIKKEGEHLLGLLNRAGLVKGDRIGVISILRPYWYSVLYAALIGGYRMVCIDPGIPNGQVQDMLKDTDTRAVLTSLPSVKLPKQLDEKIPVYQIEHRFPLISKTDKVSPDLKAAKELPKDTFFILFSSGTTGEKRKAVLLPHTTVTRGIEYGMSKHAGIYFNKPAYTVRKRDMMLFPPYHIAGLLCGVYDIYCNTQVIMMERLSPNTIVELLHSLRPDNICTVPSMLAAFMKKIQSGLNGGGFINGFVRFLFPFCGFLRRYLGINAGRLLLKAVNKKAFGGKMKGFMIGGSACDEATMRFYLNMGMDVSIAYGLTELGAPLAVSGRGYYPGTTGRVLHHTYDMDIRVVNKDESGRGEVEVLSPLRMISYMDPKQNEGCFTEDGYFKTGDVGYFDKRKCLVICGRAKETIVLRNGEKLLPEEIEEKYQDIANVSQVAVFRVPDGKCDAFSIAAIRDKSTGVPDSVTRMNIFDRGLTLPPMYRPKEVYMLNEFPLSSTKKVQRFRLTEMVEKGLDIPVTESSMKEVDKDETVAALRSILIDVAGPSWKTAKLTEGMPLGIDSLQIMDVFVAVQEKFGVDLFELSNTPETFGQLVDAVKNFEFSEKKVKENLDLSKYPEPLTEKEQKRAKRLERLLAWYYNVKVKGASNLEDGANYLFCSNHITYIDPAWICGSMPEAMRQKTAVIGKSTLVDDKKLKAFVKLQNYVPISRTGNSMPTIERVEELLKQGWNALIFPEGTNYENAKEMLPFKDGPAKIALDTGCQIVPVHIKGVVLCDGDNIRFLPPRGDKVEIIFGKPFSPKGMSVPEFNQVLCEKIAKL